MDNLAMRLEKLAVEEGLEFSYNFFPGNKRRKEPAEHQVFLTDADDEAYLGTGETVIAALEAAEENYKKGEIFDFVDEDDDD